MRRGDPIHDVIRVLHFPGIVPSSEMGQIVLAGIKGEEIPTSMPFTDLGILFPRIPVRKNCTDAPGCAILWTSLVWRW
jgi:hypothetical protein